MSDVTYTRAEVENARPDWNKVIDCVEGETAVKAKKKTYLPQPNPTDKSKENEKRFEHYIERASFFNATGRTLTGMMGLAFRNKPEIELPKGIEDLQENIDGHGTPAFTQAHDIAEQVLKTARSGLLVDYPQREGATSRAEQSSVRPKILSYPATSIINWRVDSSGKLSLVVLYENVDEGTEFKPEPVEQWRELRMEGDPEVEDGPARYVVRVWRKTEGKKELVVHDESTPLNAAGATWDEIPFVFVGAIDNNPNIDRAPLFDLACVNIAHYRNSADYEESAFMVGQPTLVIAGLDDETEVFLGSRSAIGVEIGGRADLLEASPNTLAGSAMEKKEQQMVALGARLLTPGEAAKTAEQSRSETAAAHSPLSLACENISIAYRQAFTWAAMFDSTSEPKVSYEIHSDFTGLVTNPQLLAELIKSWQSGGVPKSDLWASLRQIGVISPDKSDDDIQDELDAEGGGLDLGDE